MILGGIQRCRPHCGPSCDCRSQLGASTDSSPGLDVLRALVAVVHGT